MRLHRTSRPLWLLPLLMAGCSSTMGSRFGGTPQSKSIAVVGDRPLPAVTGEPGARAVADEEQPEPRLNPKKRISGRVVDEAGDPVAGATVRLADGAGKGGKEIRGTTDRTGAFSLNGLRPGSTYVLIAEAEDEHGPTRGQVEARTAEAGVEIAVTSEENRPTARRTARPSKVKPISNRETTGEDADGVEPPRLNREDVAPPADEVDTLDPGPPPPTPVGRPQLSAPQPGVGWKNSKNATASRPRDADAEGDTATADSSPRRRRPAQDQPSVDPDEGTNPLPPALDPGGDASPDEPAPASSKANSPRKVGAKASPKPRDSGEIALAPEASLDKKADRARSIAKESADPFQVASLDPMPSLMPDLDPAPAVSRDSAVVAESGKPATSSEEGLLAMPPLGGGPIAVVAREEAPAPTTSPPGPSKKPQDDPPTNPAPQPVFASNPPTIKPGEKPDSPADYNPFANLPPAKAPLDRVAANPPTDPPTADHNPSATADGPPKKKWGELAANDPPPVVVQPTKLTLTGALLRRIRPQAENRDRDAPIALCVYDTKLRKINDFRLPDLEGKPVRFQELDADYILLDFWGTWCEPCLDSIPHLVALQKKYGPDKLKVVGIACEEVPPEQRKAKVDEVARRLGINYPLLLSTMDGKPCPVQQALQIQAMPTMILVDRRGQVLWRNTGSTPSIEGRLDKLLALTLGRAEAARR
jgi:thiol-disulfide isomerase/thioredoxin